MTSVAQSQLPSMLHSRENRPASIGDACFYLAHNQKRLVPMETVPARNQAFHGPVVLYHSRGSTN